MRFGVDLHSLLRCCSKDTVGTAKDGECCAVAELESVIEMYNITS